MDPELKKKEDDSNQLYQVVLTGGQVGYLNYLMQTLLRHGLVPLDDIHLLSGVTACMDGRTPYVFPPPKPLDIGKAVLREVSPSSIVLETVASEPIEG